MKIPSYLRSKYPGVVFVTGLGGLVTIINLASAQSWQATRAPALPWNTVACSADGIKLVAAGEIGRAHV